MNYNVFILSVIGASILIVPIYCSTTVPPDPCITAKPFPHTQDRSITNNHTSALNDRYIIPGWYRLNALSIPSESDPPEYNHCGTKYPVFLKESPLLNTSQIQTIATCFRTSVDVCNVDADVKVKVKVCSPSVLVYYLVSTGTDQTAYCVGPLESGAIPDFSTVPTVSYNLVTLEGYKEFRFFCNFSESAEQLFYQAHWYVNNRFIYTSTLETYDDPQNERVLTEARLREQDVTTVGFDIYCEIRAGFGASTAAGLPSTSKAIFIGIEVLTPTVTVTEKRAGEILIRATAEIGCIDNPCPYGVTANIPKPEDVCSPTVRGDTACGVTIISSAWSNVYTIKITGKFSADFYDRGIMDMIITLAGPANYIDHPFWANYVLKPITVYVESDTTAIEMKQCVISCDPYVSTFESRRLTMQAGGTYTMYQNTDYNIEVQVRNEECTVNDYAYCVCGVVVRVGQTVFMLNHCSVDHWFIDYILCNDGGDILDVKKFGSAYQITLPTGAILTIFLYTGKYQYLDVYVFPSAKDVGISRGLCGNVTNSSVWDSSGSELILRDGSTTDTDEDFLDSWKTPVDEDLFRPNNLNSLDAWARNYTTCTCNQGYSGKQINEIECLHDVKAQVCHEDADFRKVHQKRCISPSRKKRSIPTPRDRPTPHWRIKRDVSWKNGWTSQSANEFCDTLFNSSNLVVLCKDIPGVDVEGPKLNCVSDIQLSGTDEFALAAVDDIRGQCLREVRMNVTLRNETSPGKPSVLKMVKAVACPFECSNNGRCSNGTCVCNNGYAGSACSVDLSQPPLAASLEADGYCDLQDSKCDEMAVFGGNFVVSETFKCRVLSLGSNKEIQMKRSPVIESIGEVACPLPVNRQKRSASAVPVVDDTVTGYKVSVANDGQTFSRQLTMVIMNSECMTCTINGETVTCKIYEGFCYTDNRCYREDENYMSNSRYQCQKGEWKYTSNGGASACTVPNLPLATMILCAAICKLQSIF